MGDQPGFFDLADRLAGLSKTGDPLERLIAVVDFEVFRPELDRVLRRSDRSKGGRPFTDAVLMFKILVLQALYGLSGEQAEFQIQDRLTFMRSLCFGLGAKVPDYSTIWRFREAWWSPAPWTPVCPVRPGAVRLGAEGPRLLRPGLAR